MGTMKESIKEIHGFTLIETIMVIVVLGIIGTGILMYFVGLGSSGNLTIQPQAASLAREKIEKILADKNANGFSSIVSEPAALMTAPFDRFTGAVEVFCVQEADLNISSGTMPDCADSDIKAKRIRVTVSWTGGSADYITVITNH